MSGGSYGTWERECFGDPDQRDGGTCGECMYCLKDTETSCFDFAGTLRPALEASCGICTWHADMPAVVWLDDDDQACCNQMGFERRADK